ncbi:MAG: class I tRNA ligase family protein, partial [Rhodospirillales bacterium]|nr:class I tRNA ligase family protein [Rhodospirillales bacterium]
HLLLGSDVKMSKSLGNVLNVRDVLGRGYRASALRYVLLSTHYRKQLRFTWDSLAQAEEALRRLMDCLGRLDTVTVPGAPASVAQRAQAARDAFEARIADDLNTPGAIGVMFELVRDVNTAIDAGELGADDVPAVRGAFDRFDDVLGVIALRRREEAAPPVDVAEIERLIEERRAARRQRDFGTADRIRNELDARGVVLEDTPAGTRWKRK